MKLDYDCIIVGAGPAGITSAIYLKRANLNILVLEKEVPGGQLNKTSIVENYPGYKKITGPDLADKFFDQIKELDVDYKRSEVLEIIDKQTYKIVKTKKEEITCKSIILAIGRKPKSLKLDNEDNLSGRGISFCSLCDGALYKGEDVAIVGGGNSALEEALYLADICKSVTILYRGLNLRGDKILVDKILNKDNIKVIYEAVVDKFNSENDILTSLDIKVKENIENIKVKACFIFIGYEPATDFLKNLDILDEEGYITVDEGCRSKINKIYACGDVVKKEAFQIVTATSDGAIAAVSCIKDFNDEE